MSNKRKYDLREMENTLQRCYEAWEKEDSESTRTNLFKSIQELALAILNVSKYFVKYNIDYEITSYEYGVYLFERIIVGSFKPIPNAKKKTKKILEKRFPWQNYISINIKHIIFSMKDELTWQEIITEMNDFIDTTEIMDEMQAEDWKETDDKNFKQFDRKVLSKKLLKALLIFYPFEEIRRLLPISIECIHESDRRFIPSNAPMDIQDFCIVLIGTAKRLASQYTYVDQSLKDYMFDDPKRVLGSATRSSIFLTAIANSEVFPRQLMLSLDTESLYRLVSVAGGQTIRIPTQRELDSLLGAVVSVSRIVMGDKQDILKAINESKYDFDLIFSNQINIESFVRKILASLDVFGEDDHSVPLLNMLASSIESVDKLLGNLITEADNPKMVLDQYKELATTFNQFTSSLISITEKAESKLQEETL